MGPQISAGMNLHLIDPDTGIVFANGVALQIDDSELMIKRVKGDDFDLHGNIIIGIEDRIRGLHIFKGEILDYGESLIQVINIVFVETQQRREDVRVNFGDYTTVSVCFEDVLEQDGQKKSSDVYLKNISVGGMMFESDEDIDIKLRISTELKLKDGTVKIPDITILRKYYDKIRETYTYGCRFNYIPRIAANNLRNYIYAQQLKHRRKGNKYLDEE
ncbi:MAG: PilZ domain-containing protein [Oscillospiraceae bacterium]|nr:PilZ domain-containing protein [Oscillospiraceae bacterium]